MNILRTLGALILLTSLALTAMAQRSYPTVFETSGGKQSAVYDSIIAYYDRLDDNFKTIKVTGCGFADGGQLMRVVYYSADERFDTAAWHREGKLIILINNGIHAGEPDGIDASMMLLRDIAMGKVTMPDNVVLAIIPTFNIGGTLNRNSRSRANQNGPLEYGFRGNAANLDLNRDFMKADASETRSLQRLFTALDPDVFIDNHVSDGADYQHIMTLLPTQHDKLGGACGHYLYNTFTPAIYRRMKKAGYDLVPYVNNFDNTPERGWVAFYEPPRFASGYAALFQCFGFVVETHMLKPFAQRVTATYQIVKDIAQLAGENATAIKNARKTDRTAMGEQTSFPLQWRVDTTRPDTVLFKGYASGYKTSAVSGLPRLYYDRNQPFSRKVPYYDHYNPIQQVTAPAGYVIPAAWPRAVQRLIQNNINVVRFARDTTLEVTAYNIDNYETGPRPYEGHYLHRNITVTTRTTRISFLKGDWYVPLQQRGKRFIVEALEPTAPDGFFAWNYFDGVLSQKEYFGDYVFEDVAAEELKRNPALQQELKEKQRTDTTFAKNAQAQLDFIYRSAGFLEPGYLRYPVYRVEQ